MSFDGEYQTESPEFSEVDKAWRYADNLGSKWFFYPFYFLVTNSGKTIKDACDPLKHLVGKRTETVVALFKSLHTEPEATNMDAIKYACFVAENS